MIGHVVKARDVAAFDLGDIAQLGLTVQVAGGAHHPNDFEDCLFPFADDKDVNEGGHRFRVVAGVATGDDQRIAGVALGAADGHSGQVHHIEGVGEKLFVGQAKAKQVELADVSLVFQRVEGDALLAHDRFHVGPGGVNALCQEVAVLVDQVVEDHQPQVGHAEVVDVGEGEGDFVVNIGPVFADLVVFAAGVAARFGDAGEDAF